MMDSRAADVIGIFGAVTILGGFAYRTLRNAARDGLSNTLNFIAASVPALPQTMNYTVPALLLKTAWGGIALFGLLRTVVARR